MNLIDKIEKIADVLDCDAAALTPDTRLEDIGWDSMGMLSVIALAKQNGKTILGDQIRTFTTLDDVLKAVF